MAGPVVAFAAVEAEEPDFATRVRAVFDTHVHKVLATLRADGSPRVSGIEARFADGELWLAGMPRTVKFADLRRDPRMALHSGSDDPDSFTADAKLSGRAVEITNPARLAAFAGSPEVPGEAQPVRAVPDRGRPGGADRPERRPGRPGDLELASGERAHARSAHLSAGTRGQLMTFVIVATPPRGDTGIPAPGEQ